MKLVLAVGRQRGYSFLQSLNPSDIQHVFIYPEDAHEEDPFKERIASYAQAEGIPHSVTAKIGRNNLEQIADSDLMVVFGWSRMIPTTILETPQKGAVAVHDSLLPKYRGFCPSNWAIINGEKESGVTLFYLGERMDEGDIIAQRGFPIALEDTILDVRDKVTDHSLLLFKDYIPLLVTGNAPRIVQDHSLATYGCKRTPLDGRIDWTQTTSAVYNLIRALIPPYAGAFSSYKGETFVVTSASPSDRKYAGTVPGRVAFSSDDGVDVCTRDGAVRLRELRVEGKIIPAKDYLKSVSETLQ